MKLGAVFLVIVTAVAVAQPKSAYLGGTVMSAYVTLPYIDAVIAGVRVEISSSDAKCVTTANDAGRFGCRLPPGRYTITSTSPFYYPYSRATVILGTADILIDLRTVPGPMRGITVSEQGFIEDHVGPVTYQTSDVLGRDVVIRYGSKTPKDQETVFKGPYLMLTMNTLSVYANQITCESSFKTCTAIGDVMVEVGAERTLGTKVELNLDTGKFVLDRAAQVVGIF